jgi:hypothetical protein
MTTPPRESTVPVAGASVERVEPTIPEPGRYMVRRFDHSSGCWINDAFSFKTREDAVSASGKYLIEIIDTRPSSPPAQAPQGGDTRREPWIPSDSTIIVAAVDDGGHSAESVKELIRETVAKALAQKPEAREVPEAFNTIQKIIERRISAVSGSPCDDDADDAYSAQNALNVLRAFLGGDGEKGGQK